MREMYIQTGKKEGMYIKRESIELFDCGCIIGKDEKGNIHAIKICKECNQS